MAYLKLLTEPPYVNRSDPTAAQVFLYNVLANQAAVHLDRANGSRVVTTADNDAAAMNGYTVSEQLYRVARTRFDAAELPDWDEVLDDDCCDGDNNNETSEPRRDHEAAALDCPMKFRPCDLGITLVMLAFGSYYSRKQYPIFVNAMKTVRELELLERFLLTAGRCGQSTARGNVVGGVRLDANLAVDPRYGLLANRHRFQGTRYLRVDDFEAICAIARSRHSRPEEFVEALQPFDSAIVESFYMFTSVTRDAKMIAECRELSCPRFVYTFDRPQRSERYDGRFWFRVPPRSTWFAYSQKRWSFQSYLGRDSDSLMRRLDGIKALVVGYVHDRALYPVFVDHPLFVGRWLETMYCFAALGFPIVLRDDQPPDNLNTFYYVRDGDGALYRFHRPRRPAP